MIKVNDFFTKRNDQSQILEYNNPQFECYSVSSYFSPNQRYFVPDHWHEDLEYFYVIEGELKFHVNGQTIILHAKEGIPSASIPISLCLEKAVSIIAP